MIVMPNTEKIMIAIGDSIKNAIYKIKNISKFHSNLWLISERGNDAQDNGYILYKYLVEHPELNIHPVYLISKFAKDYQKVAKLGGDIVEPNSSRHNDLIYQAGALISTHTYGYTPNMQIYHRLAQAHLFHPKGINAFLQHGINDKKEDWVNRDMYRPDMYVTSASAESEITEVLMNQPRNVIKEIGMCRYDVLHNAGVPDKQILIMPTWREWLRDLNKTDFIQSEYCTKWRKLLFDKSFIFKLSKAGYKIVFYLHPELKQYADLFTHDAITVATEGVQDIMMKSEMLVTDYSSVYFDMAYMDRNIVFYQFDKKRYETEHYSGLLMDHSKFGYVANDDADLKEAILNGCRINGKQKIYGDRVFMYEFFSHHDNKQCYRTYKEIRLLQKKPVSKENKD